MVNVNNLRSLGNNEYLIDIAIKAQTIDDLLKDVAIQWIPGQLNIDKEITDYLQAVLNKEQMKKLIRHLKITFPVLLHN